MQPEAKLSIEQMHNKFQQTCCGSVIVPSSIQNRDIVLTLILALLTIFSVAGCGRSNLSVRSESAMSVPDAQLAILRPDFSDRAFITDVFDDHGRDAVKRSGWEAINNGSYTEVRLLPGRYKVQFSYATPGIPFNGVALPSINYFSAEVLTKAGMTYFFTPRFKDNTWMNGISTLEIATLEDTTRGLSGKDGRTAFERLRVQNYLRRQVLLPLDRPLTFVSGNPLDFEQARRISRSEKTGDVVRVRFRVRPDGDVDSLKVISESPLEFNQLLLQTVVTWKFQPISRGGKPTEVQLEYSLNTAAL